MSRRTLAPAVAAAGVLVVLATVSRTTSPQPAAAPLDTATPVPEATVSLPPAAGVGFVTYAVDVTELDGLPPDVAPGQELDLWVAWDPPITKRTVVQPLLEGVVLEKVAPPVLPDGPAAALFLVPRKKVGDLIWADRYGALSVVLENAALP